MDNEQVRQAVLALVAFVVSVTVHEFGHAFVADKLGDRLPRYQGRVTLNPVAHADPLGTLLFPVLGGILSGSGLGFGWGRPVQTNPASYTRRVSMRIGHLMVAAAGPAMNILFGTFISLILLLLFRASVVQPHTEIYSAVSRAIAINYILAFFNLIPSPPLDGGTVLEGVLPTRFLPAFERFKPYGFFVLLAFLMISQLQILFLWPALKLYGAVTGLLGLP